MIKIVYPADVLPREGEYVIYHFYPFDGWYTGTYSEGSVYGRHGFTTWTPEVTMWMKGEEEGGEDQAHVCAGYE